MNTSEVQEIERRPVMGVAGISYISSCGRDLVRMSPFPGASITAPPFLELSP